MKNRLGIVTQPFEVGWIDRELPVLKPDEVLIRIRASAVCGSDLHIYRGKHPSVSLPCTIGHELSGDIAEMGSDADDLSAGDRVTLEPVIPCGECNACRIGEYGYCERLSFTYRNGDGAMAEYIVAKRQWVYKLPERLSYEAGALVEPLAVAVHAARRACVEPGDRVAVFGAGAIGILVAAVCALRGADIVAVSDIVPARLDMARTLGATHMVNAKAEDALARMAEISGRRGMTKTFECAGAAVTYRQAVLALAKNGLMTSVGIFEQPEITLDVSRFITHELRLQGAQGYCGDFSTALEFAQRLPLESLVTHQFPLHQLKTALDTAVNPLSGAIKVIVKP